MEQDIFKSLPEFDKHHLVTFLHDESTGMEAVVAIHRKSGNVPSFGATRLWKYDTSTDALRDALRLSRLMSYKAALAGLPCGGAKAVILDKGTGDNTKVLEAYADNIRVLKDSFITGTDVGIRQDDLALLKARTPNIIGFNNNTTEFTALGICHGIRCALREVFSDDSISGKTFAVQGLGKIGRGIVEILAPEAQKIYVADIDPEALQWAQAFDTIEVVSPETIHKQNVDVFCPCAMGSAINTHNVAELSCSIVAGGANNQLENDDVGDIMHKMNILYAPDYVVNAGGLIAVFDEYEHPNDYSHDRVRDKVIMIEQRLQDIIVESRIQKRPTNRIANDHAEKTFNSYD